ncbi:MAG TPA: dolichyl-phosphate beta-glucosyltransferase [Candidatus Binatia bacterium]|nr:dolichyl-phosphate beta-glucosyltransferase [Candidatus Binatia bacterium]
MPSRESNRPAISVVIPCFNEARRLNGTLETLVAFLASHPETWEIVAVDDGSTDETGRLARERFPDEPRVRVLRYERNHGKGWSVCEGFRASTGDLVLFTDADLATPITELPRFLAEAARGVDLVIASRYARGARIAVPQPPRRRLSAATFRALVRLLRLSSASDTQCGFKLMRRTTMAPILDRVATIGFAFDVELLHRTERAGLRIAELPVEWHDVAGSKIRLWPDAARMAGDLVRLRWQLRS